MVNREILALVNALPIPAMLVSPDERVSVANSGCRTLLGRGVEGRHYITILRQPTLLDAVERALKDGRTEVAPYLSTEASRDLTWRVTAAPLDLGAGQGVLLSFEDITALQEAGQMRRDFVANVSHELRTPLTALMGFIETLRGAARQDASARDRFLTIMEREASRMNRLVADLLSLSRVESEERVRPTERVEIGRACLMVIATLRPMAEEHGMTLQPEDLDRSTSVVGDPDQLAQVFTNLIENALKYGKGGGQVRVSLSETVHEPMLRGPAVTVVVEDDGEGFDPVHIPRLTERFYRVDNHRSREMGGTGLGLAIVKHIVNRHRGRLRIESQPGVGSRFSVMLPRA